MGEGSPDILTLVKRGYVRHPVAIAAGAVSLLALLAANLSALSHGLDWPWLLGSVVLADMLAIGAGILVASRVVLSAAHRSEASEARLASILDSAMDAILTVDEEQRIVLFNRSAELVFGVRRDDALGTTLERFLPSRFRAGHRAHVEDFGRTGVTGRRMGDTTMLYQ
ncbi:MAG: PAS domain S-box protein [Gammaproteobacteria bacterium]|nr:PAS domain S-box protein [Gammaproteobacteria bacterium]